MEVLHILLCTFIRHVRRHITCSGSHNLFHTNLEKKPPIILQKIQNPSLLDQHYVCPLLKLTHASLSRLKQPWLVEAGLSLNQSRVQDIKTAARHRAGAGVRSIISLNNWSMFTLLDVETNTECGTTSQTFPPRNVFPGYRWTHTVSTAGQLTTAGRSWWWRTPTPWWAPAALSVGSWWRSTWGSLLCGASPSTSTSEIVTMP